ncbi:cytoplasmic tRNA 2-thiolation protein 2-A [Lingula anatina]|uniref:Cytoplasmic tRNA 2-thiolation protein 2 n=1 Tax=Lingula anatina TaxID=7574 RepID=A0A1S3JE92_LINAN|nr:cytoplasmic tRNA 2-thiolation protein 2-A [Lingula anatina]|eukprot:XP_013408735.1 cytoplasmic tRNA 2-thiolation protein 2-A [Lingula anatina]
MCSVQDGEDVIPERKKTGKFTEGERRPCMKCGESAAVIIRVNDAFCRGCFLTYCTHKFRSAFGKSKLIRDGEKVLVAFSGGQSSTALLHLIQEGLSERAQKKLRFIPSFVFIDEGAVLNQTQEERSETCQQVAALLQQSGFPWNIISLEKIMQESNSLEKFELSEQFESLHVSEKDQEELKSLWNSVKTLSAKEEMIRTLRSRLLVSIATAGGYSKVLVGDTGTKLSIRLLSDVAQGRGMHLPFETGFADCRHPEMKIVRPVRDFTAKEVAMYNAFHNLQPLVLPALTTKAASNASIERLTETFVTGLQADFPSTVSTIFRTGEKLSVEDMDSEVDRCQFCQAPLDTNVPASSALNATLFSQSLSQKSSTSTIGGASNCDKTDSCCGEGDGSCQTQKDFRLTKEDLADVLCYGCRLVIKDMNSVDDLLPANVLQSAAAAVRRKKMKDEIQDFLLPS